jgi:hypothetical protein
MCSLAPCSYPCTPIIPSPFHSHTPDAAVTRCWHMLLCSAAAACCVAAYHSMPGWTCGQCHPPSWLLCELLHTTTLSPSVHCPDRASAVSCSTRRCGRAYRRYSNTTPMPCARGGRRQTWFDSSTSHAPTAWVTAFPSRTAACVPTGRAVASRLQVAFVALRTTPPSPNLTLHCTLSTSMSPMPANRDENCLQRVASASLTRRV